MTDRAPIAMHQTVPPEETQFWIAAALRDALTEAEKGDFRFLDLRLTRADGKDIRVQIVPES